MKLLDVFDNFKNVWSLSGRDRPEEETPAQVAQRLRIVRGFAVIELVMSMLASVALPLVLLWTGPAAVSKYSVIWYFIIAPAVFSGGALMVYHARAIKRPWSSTLGELCFWLTFPVGATIFLFAVQWRYGGG